MINFIKNMIFSFTKEGIKLQRKQMIQRNCQHSKWYCDKQIRIIECKECGLRAWIDGYVDLYKK